MDEAWSRADDVLIRWPTLTDQERRDHLVDVAPVVRSTVERMFDDMATMNTEVAQIVIDSVIPLMRNEYTRQGHPYGGDADDEAMLHWFEMKHALRDADG